MSSVHTFLRERIAEDRQIARAATDGPWRVVNETYAEAILSDTHNTYVLSGSRWGGEASVFNDTADALHIVRHDPARVLLQCEAIESMLELREGYSRGPGAGAIERTIEIAMGVAIDEALLSLANTWRDHPDWDPAWEIRDTEESTDG